ncbi:MAG: hypothetical protein HYV20_02620 [Gemmatimonadetes bacterium]|nr:hypothetical protein [Gemmatimonadota bacterium]
MASSRRRASSTSASRTAGQSVSTARILRAATSAPREPTTPASASSSGNRRERARFHSGDGNATSARVAPAATSATRAQTVPPAAVQADSAPAVARPLPSQ